MSEERRFQISVDFPRMIEQLGDSIYPRREEVLLELVRNADDAVLLRQARNGFPARSSGRIAIAGDPHAGELSVQDNGIGIGEDQFEVLLSQLVVAHRQFDRISNRDIAIGSLGLGFFGGFLLADRIEFLSETTAPRRLSVLLDDRGTATVRTDDTAGETGTRVRLHLRQECRYLTERSALEQFVRTRCRYIKTPIYLNGSQEAFQALYTVAGEAGDDDELSARIDSALKASRLAFDRNPSVGGLRPDFVVYGPKGQTIIVEAKSWSAGEDNIRRAIHQAERYKHATGVNSVLMVLGTAGVLPKTPDVVGVAGLIDAIQSEFTKLSSSAAPVKPIKDSRQTVFAAMPFSGEYDDVFFVAMAYAAEQNGATCVRVDKEQFSGDVVDKIRSLIRQSVAVICDLSEARPNVLYEAGYSHALEKPTIHVCSTPMSELPFDVRNWNTLSYEQGRTHHLREPLTARLQAALA